MTSLFSKPLLLLVASAAALFVPSCISQQQQYGPDVPPRAVVRDGVAITLRDQKLTLFRQGKKVKDYDISSSKFGIGTRSGSNRTPVGVHAVTQKVGEGMPEGMVFKACRPTGEVVPVDAAGRDPVVTRVIQIAGLERYNANSHNRRIYIHGTPEERKIGSPASYGCIRMRSKDVVELYRHVYRGMPVAIETCSQKTYLAAEKNSRTRRISLPMAVVDRLPSENHSFRATGNRYSGSRLVSRKSSSASRLASRKTGSSSKGKSSSKSAMAKNSSKGSNSRALASNRSGGKNLKSRGNGKAVASSKSRQSKALASNTRKKSRR